MIDSVIFDLDGTLLNTLDDLTAATNYALETFGLGGISIERVRAFVGNGVPKLIERALYFATTGKNPLTGDDRFADKGLLNACLAVFTQYYDAHNADRTAPYGGVCDLLRQLKDMGIKTAVVTNKYNAAAKALCADFFPTVDCVVGAQDGIRPKPSPDGVKKALDILHSDVTRSVYAGDGETDMQTAAACGIPVVAVTWGFRDREALAKFDPDLIIDAPSEMIGALRSRGMLK